jgi:fructokinase
LSDLFFFDRVSVGALTAARKHFDAGHLVVYEPSNRGWPELQKRAVELAHIVKYSIERAVECERYLPRGPEHQLRIVTEGSRGARFRLGGRPWIRLEPFSTDVIDAAGAGDWMTAALLDRLPKAGKWDTSQLEEALRFAQAVAALSCRLPGARTLADVIDARALRKSANEMIRGGTARLAAPRDSFMATRKGRCEECLLPLGRR